MIRTVLLALMILCVAGLERGNRDICSQPIVSGNGKARISAWAYDPSRGCCVHFFYRGSGGNANRFQTLKKCRRACGNVFNK
ncbi:Kunitz-type serine protease inhibitor conotoxin [Taenia crassiceps]|uniref:Kunitz-type serine protease inhibitor conotoxin n=1 Tax=Taenia crassiceps TaxID=6207 RepID=A0ABR4QC84_9CEST